MTSAFPSMYSRAGCSSMSGSSRNSSRVKGVRTREGIDIARLLGPGEARRLGRGDIATGQSIHVERPPFLSVYLGLQTSANTLSTTAFGPDSTRVIGPRVE